MNKKINIPKDVQIILNRLMDRGYEAYIVGGCVRDNLLKKNPNDYDITTSAKPEEIIDCFKDFRVIPTGLKHGTVTVLLKDIGYEITTYRIEGKYTDCRRPDTVEFTTLLYEDLKRRDFTINAMAYNSQDGLIDYFQGEKDLESKTIRTVGVAEERFSEDALRMMRAVRFSAQLDFNIEEDTEKAIIKNAKLIDKISIERIREEFNKIIISNPFMIKNLYNYGLLNHFIPEYYLCEITEQNNPYHIYKVGEHILRSMEAIENKLHLRLTMLLHDICKPQCKTTDDKGIDHFYGHQKASAEKAEEILKRMKYDNLTIDKVLVLIEYHDRDIESKKSIRKVLNKIGEESFRDLLKVKAADMKAQNPEYYNSRYEKLIKIEKDFEEIIESNQCFNLKDLKIKGYDLVQLGVKEGKDIGLILNSLLDKVLENPELNHREKLLSIVKEEYNL